MHASLLARNCACAFLKHPARRISSLSSSPSTDLRRTTFTRNNRQSVQRIQRRKQQFPRALLAETITAITDTPLRDVLAVGFSVVGARVLVNIFDYLEENRGMDKVKR